MKKTNKSPNSNGKKNRAKKSKHTSKKHQSTGKLRIKKHQHIFMLKELLRLKNEAVMKLAHCNAGEIYNVLHEYKKHRTSRIKKLEELMNGD